MKKPTKYEYWNVIQQHYGQGWEDVSHYESSSTGISSTGSGKFKELSNGRKREISLLAHDLAEYRLTGYSTRVIFRKELRMIN